MLFNIGLAQGIGNSWLDLEKASGRLWLGRDALKLLGRSGGLVFEVARGLSIAFIGAVEALHEFIGRIVNSTMD